MDGSINLTYLRRLCGYIVNSRDVKASVCVEISTFYYDHDQHVSEMIQIWDSLEQENYFAKDVNEAEEICKLIEKGDENALAKYTKRPL